MAAADDSLIDLLVCKFSYTEYFGNNDIVNNLILRFVCGGLG